MNKLLKCVIVIGVMFICYIIFAVTTAPGATTSSEIRRLDKSIEQIWEDLILIDREINKKYMDTVLLNYLITQEMDRMVIAYNLPTNTTGEFKSWMPYTAITAKKSLQWKMQQDAITAENGIRLYDGRPMVAMATYYAQCVGKILTIGLDTGLVFEVVVGDIKSDAHTNEDNMYTLANGCIIEFIVCENKLCEKVRQTGDVSCLGYEGKIVSITSLEN